MVTEEKLTGNGSKYRKKRETDHEEDKSYLKQVKKQKTNNTSFKWYGYFYPKRVTEKDELIMKVRCYLLCKNTP